MCQFTLFNDFEDKHLNEFKTPQYWNPRDFTSIWFYEYLVNRKGQIKNVNSGKFLNQTRPDKRNESNPYITKALKSYNKTQTFYLHRIIACTFLKCINRQTYTQVNHIDGNRQNNHILNLEWSTPSQNMKDFWKREDPNQLKIV